MSGKPYKFTHESLVDLSADGRTFQLFEVEAEGADRGSFGAYEPRSEIDIFDRLSARDQKAIRERIEDYFSMNRFSEHWKAWFEPTCELRAIIRELNERRGWK